LDADLKIPLQCKVEHQLKAGMEMDGNNFCGNGWKLNSNTAGWVGMKVKLEGMSVMKWTLWGWVVMM